MHRKTHPVGSGFGPITLACRPQTRLCEPSQAGRSLRAVEPPTPHPPACLPSCDSDTRAPALVPRSPPAFSPRCTIPLPTPPHPHTPHHTPSAPPLRTTQRPVLRGFALVWFGLGWAGISNHPLLLLPTLSDSRHASVEHSRHSVLPVPVGLSSSAFLPCRQGGRREGHRGVGEGPWGVECDGAVCTAWAYASGDTATDKDGARPETRPGAAGGRPGCGHRHVSPPKKHAPHPY